MLAPVAESEEAELKAAGVRRNAAFKLVKNYGKNRPIRGSNAAASPMRRSKKSETLQTTVKLRMVSGRLAPLLARDRVLKIVAKAPTILQYNITRKIEPKLKFVRYLCGGGATAHDLVTNHPRVLLSSFGVLGRVCFLHRNVQSCLEEEGMGAKQANEAVAIDAMKVKLYLRGIMESRIKFFALHNPEYHSFLQGTLREASATGRLIPDMVIPPSKLRSITETDDRALTKGSLVDLLDTATTVELEQVHGRYLEACMVSRDAV